MKSSIQKSTKFVHDLHAYHDGTLPLVKQEFHQPAIEILRCSHWLISVWNHSNLSAPYWRLYWNRDAGAVVRLGGVDYSLGPESLLLISPRTPFRTFLGAIGRQRERENVMVGCPYDSRAARRLAHHPLSGAVRHFFTHFTAGSPYDGIGAHIYRLAVGPALHRALVDLTDSLLKTPGALDHRQSLAHLALIHYALAQVPEKDWPAIPTDRRVVRLMEYMDASLEGRFSNEDLARQVGLTASALTRLFRRTTGQTPLAYLKQKRIERASILLHHTDYTVEQVAEACGFCNRHYFSKVFAETHGVGPATYRKMRLS